MSEYELYHIDDRGYNIDLSKEQEKLAWEAYERFSSSQKDQIEETDESNDKQTNSHDVKTYIDELYTQQHDEYLVNGAILQCNMATTDVKVLRGNVYNVSMPDTSSILEVTENPKAKCCGYLYHATVKDRKAGDNIPPFRCNCKREPHNDKEWAKLTADKSCMKEGTCKALINLNDEWDNLPTVTPYMMFWNEDRRGMVPGITMSSMLFCRHGGIITAVESGQNLIQLLDSINSIAYSNGELWTDEMIDMAKYVTEKMFMEGYSLDMIAGFVGNFVNEGNFGYFESSHYVNNPEPDYLKHMDKIHGYDTKASGMYLSDVGTGILEELRKDGNCSDASHGFGLGSVQWTYERCEALIDRYLDKFGNSYFPTKEECTEVEIDYALYELSGPYKDVVIKCEKQTSGMSDSEKVAKITEIVMTDYEIPSVSNLSKRQEAADIWYNILIGGNNGN